MPQVLKRPQAETDLDDIWWYIAKHDPDNADRFLEKIEERCLVPAQFSSHGRKRKELMPSLRSLAVENYLIFYLPINDGIEVVRILPGMRDIDTVF